MPTQPDDILLNKATIIERCIRRIKEEYQAAPALDNFTHIDAMTLNIERACQAAIDMAMHIISVSHYGIPQSSADAFAILQREQRIPEPLSKSMRAMTGFRNIAVHQYQELSLEILRHIAKTSRQDLVSFCKALGITIKP